MLSTIFGIGAGYVMNQLNNQQAAERAEYDRLRNFQLNERAAQNADYRTRQLYADFYSPEAQLRQAKEAGLSPSIYYGGTPGQGGMSGAQGGGSNIQTPYMPMSLLEGAQIANIKAQTEAVKAETKKTEAETGNISQDTKLKEIQTEWQEMQKNEYSVDFKALTSYVINDDGSKSSLYELADNFTNYENFSKFSIKRDDIFASEKGQRVLRSIWLARKHFDTQIAILGSEEVSATFQKDLLNAMRNEDFIKLNAEAAKKYLEQNISTAELTERQKSAWIRLLDKFGEEGDWKQDLVIVLGQIVNNAMTNYKMPTINNNYRTTNNTTNTYNQ